MIAGYEALRAQVLASRPAPERGWAVLIRRGLLAWSAALNGEIRRVATVHRRTTPPLPTHLNRPVVQVLAGMVLQLQAEVSHEG